MWLGPQVALAGVLRHSEKPSMFVPENEPAKGAWYWLDVPALALACDLPPDTPLLEVHAGRLLQPCHGLLQQSFADVSDLDAIQKLAEAPWLMIVEVYSNGPPR